MQEFWRDGLFGDLDERYFRLVNRAPDLGRCDRLGVLGDYSPFETFRSHLPRPTTSGKESYFDPMTHFDFKTLLPALLHVEDRVSMAHGLESRVPFVDSDVVEFAATLPADVKFKDGHLKHALKEASGRTSRRRSSTAATRWASPCRSANGCKVSCATSSSTPSGAREARSRPYLDSRFDVERLIDPRVSSAAASGGSSRSSSGSRSSTIAPPTRRSRTLPAQPTTPSFGGRFHRPAKKGAPELAREPVAPQRSYRSSPDTRAPPALLRSHARLLWRVTAAT